MFVSPFGKPSAMAHPPGPVWFVVVVVPPVEELLLAEPALVVAQAPPFQTVAAYECLPPVCTSLGALPSAPDSPLPTWYSVLPVGPSDRLMTALEQLILQ